jgi:flagellar protein FlaG
MVEGVGNLTTTALLIQAGEGVPPSPPSSSSETKKTEPDARAETAGVRSDSAAKESRQASAQPQTQDNSAPVVDEKKLEESIRQLNERLYYLDRQILFKVDKKINRSYISIIDKTTKEVIKEFPPEEIRTLMARMREFEQHASYRRGDVKNLFFDKTV